LVKKNRIADAQKALERLSTRTHEQCRGSLAQIQHTIQLESDLQAGGNYLDCFKGINLRRTEICMVVFAGQQLSGATFAYTPTYFFLQAGIATNNAFSISIGSTGMAFVGTMLSWLLLARFGRRTLYLTGMFFITAALLIVGICSAASTSAGAMWTQVSFILVWKLLYSLTVGPICYAIISETSAVRLRPQTIVIARNTYAMVQILAGVLNPYMLK
jgi:SP family general alpha glucoside:H+ symporter-like MFS transporter